MATTPQQGIMALPETDEASTPQISLHESYDAAKQGLNEADPQFSSMYNDEMSKAMPALLALSDEELDMLLQIIQYLQENPEEYAKNLQQLEQAGVIEKGDLPEQYDENFLAVFGAAVMEAQKNNEPAAPQQAIQPPMQLAKGGIAEAARMVAGQGRNGDTMLAHITKDEAAMLRKHGGAGTLNPRTGLREYGLLKKAWSAATGAVSSVTSAVSSAIKSVGSAVKTVLSSPIGKIAATVALAAFIGPAAFGLSGAAGVAAQMGLASAGITALSGGNLKDVVRAGTTGAVLGYGGAALGPAVGPAVGVTSATGQAALGAGLTSAGLGALTGKSIKDSVKDGLTSAAVAGAMTYANTEGVSRGTQGQDPSKVPVEDRVLTPETAGKVGVNQQTGQVTGGAPVPTASSDAAFNQALTNAQQGQINGLTTDSGTTTTGPGLGQTTQGPVSVAGTTPPPPPPPPVGEKSWWDKTTDYFSPSARAEAGATQAGEAYDKAYSNAITNGRSPEAAKIAADAAAKAATPGFLSNYGPAIGAGLGITALAGGFKQEQPALPQGDKDLISGKATQDIINADPSKYITQNLPGVTYDTKGNIVSSGPWTPRSGAGTTEVAGNYIPFSQTYTPPPTYTAPVGAIGGGRQIAQPYNTASMYDFRPRYAAQGGMMETQGAFPSNPLSMPSSPLMAMDSQRLPMNTPGVPMNMPMGFAMGGMPPTGIATLAPGGYPRRTGQISGPGTETSDDIPAMLSDGEFVMTAKAVKGLGKGSRRAGAKKMYSLMHRLEKNAARG
jgi:hypothetical protein